MEATYIHFTCVGGRRVGVCKWVLIEKLEGPKRCHI